MLTSQIKTDMVAAMKAREQIKVDTLRGMMSAFTNELVAKNRKPTDMLEDAEALAVLKRLAKQRKDSIEQFKKGGRAELAQKESQELAIIETYLPAGVPKDEIEKVVRAKMVELGVADKSGMGKLTGAVMKEFGGNADGNDVKDVIAAILS